MSALYYRNARGRIFEFEASTKAGEYAWFRDLHTDESVRLRVATLRPVPDAVVLALARDTAPQV